MSEDIGIRVAPFNYGATVSAEPDERGEHHGTMKHSGLPVTVTWNETAQEWEETAASALERERYTYDVARDEWVRRG